MQNIFDIRSIILISASLPLALGMVMFFYWRTRKTYQGFGYWVLANFTMGAGYALLLPRNQISDFYSVIVANSLILFGILLNYEGIQKFIGRKTIMQWGLILLTAYALGHAYLTYFSPTINGRIILVSCTVFVLEILISYTLFRYSPENLRHTTHILAIVFIVSSVLSISRVGYALYQMGFSTNITADHIFAGSLFGSIFAITIWTIFFFFLNSARLESDLGETQRSLTRAADENRHKIVHLGLLDEVSSGIAESMSEAEILQRTVTGLVKKFNYAEAAISLRVDENELEVAVIDGKEDLGYRTGFRQKIGEGIIGHTAETQQVYLTGDIASDPYYLSIGKRTGSVASIPMLSEGQLLGVLYVESIRPDAFDQDDIQTLVMLVRNTVTAVLKARLYARSQANVRAMSMLVIVSQTILSSLDLHDVFHSVVQLLKESFNYTYISLYSLHGEVLRLEAQAGYAVDEIFTVIPIAKGISGRCVQTKQPQFVRNVNRDPEFLQTANDIESEICIPILKDNRVLGILDVEAASSRSLTEDDVALLTAMSGYVVVAMENGRLHHEVMQLALTDGLTNIANRRSFDQVIEVEISRAERYQYPMSLIIIDMDCFKEYNDRRGHPAGDKRLKAVASLLRCNLRTPDFIARYGGEEFAIILPNTSKANALVLAERLRFEAESQSPVSFRTGGPIPGYTFSMGIATYPEDGASVEEIILSADRAELTAKKLGKNRISAAFGYPEPEEKA